MLNNLDTIRLESFKISERDMKEKLPQFQRSNPNEDSSLKEKDLMVEVFEPVELISQSKRPHQQMQALVITPQSSEPRFKESIRSQD